MHSHAQVQRLVRTQLSSVFSAEREICVTPRDIRRNIRSPNRATEKVSPSLYCLCEFQTTDLRLKVNTQTEQQPERQICIHTQRQKAKAFTKWANVHLAKQEKAHKIDDITKDLRDGRILCYLLAVLSGKKLSPPNDEKQVSMPSTRVQSLANRRIPKAIAT